MSALLIATVVEKPAASEPSRTNLPPASAVIKAEDIYRPCGTFQGTMRRRPICAGPLTESSAGLKLAVWRHLGARSERRNLISSSSSRHEPQAEIDKHALV